MELLKLQTDDQNFRPARNPTNRPTASSWIVQTARLTEIKILLHPDVVCLGSGPQFYSVIVSSEVLQGAFPRLREQPW